MLASFSHGEDSMFRTIEDFLERFTDQAERTGNLFATLTDESLSQPITEGHRNLGRIAWHLTTTIPEMMAKTGLDVGAVEEDAPMVATGQEIVDGYRAVSAELIEAIRTNWTDADLEVEDDMYGSKWKRCYTLQCLIDHEVHHVGQMTVLMRQAGLRVPGIYGPAKEDWAKFGMPEPTV
jgi:uncharacterized damage-inducible protein DinB